MRNVMEKKDFHSIQKIVDALVDKGIVNDPSPVSRALKGDGSFEMVNLIFYINENLPNHINHKCQTLRISLTAHKKELPAIKSLYPDNYEFKVSILGEVGEKTVINCFHIDYDCGRETLDEKDKFIHPLYHLTFGGMELDDYYVGDFLNIPSPRFAVLPMDVILIIDFILSNFLTKTKYEKIKCESAYLDELHNSQAKYWKPYFHNIGIKWANVISSKSTSQTFAFDNAFDNKYFRNLLFPTLID